MAREEESYLLNKLASSWCKTRTSTFLCTRTSCHDLVHGEEDVGKCLFELSSCGGIGGQSSFVLVGAGDEQLC